jgi:hypothetical protein
MRSQSSLLYQPPGRLHQVFHDLFYDHLGRHEEKAEALRQAQLEMLNSADPPFYWAGFVLAGDSRGNHSHGSENNPLSRSSR